MHRGTFNCNGKININDWQLNSASLLMQKEVDNVLTEKNTCLSPTLKIFDCELLGINMLLNLKHFVRCMEKNLKHLGRHENLIAFTNQTTSKPIDYYFMRERVCEFLFYLRDYLISIKSENFALKDLGDEAEKDFIDLLSAIQRFQSRLQYLPDSTFLYATSNVGNKCNQPEYHLYHAHLDLRWLRISLIHIKNTSLGCLDSNIEDLENSIYYAIGDLVYISMKIFATIPSGHLKLKTPYSCTCVRELWIMLQIFTDELSGKGTCKMFWIYVNFIMNQFFPTEVSKTVPVFPKNIELPQCKNPELFCLWLTYHLTLLYGYNRIGQYCQGPSDRFTEHLKNENINQVEIILKAYVNKGGKDAARNEIDKELCVIIPFLHSLCCDWWQPQVKIITLLWECFHRRLDQPFLLQTRGPWCTSSEKKTPMDILDQVRDRLINTIEIINESSFGLFLRLLGTCLQKSQNSDLKIWNQIKGRIFSRFSQNKIKEFSESGLYNFISLFLTIAVTTDTVQVCSAMINLLPPVLEWSDATGGKKCGLIWKSKLAVLLLYNEQKLSFKDVAESFTETANAISCRNDEFSNSMMTWYIDVFRLIIMQSEDFGRHEHAFLGGWIDRHLLESAPHRVGVLTNTLLNIFEKCNCLQSTNTMGSSLMLHALWKHVASRVRQMVTTCDLSTDIFENPTKLAVAFTLEACRDPVMAKKYNHSVATLFRHFTTSVLIKDTRITRMFLTSILKNDIALQILKREITNFNISCIQAWVKCNILNSEENSDNVFLKTFIITLPEIKNIFNSEKDVNEFLQSNESIINFLMIVSKKRNTCKTEQEIASFDTMCRTFFFNIDKWVLQLINEDNKDTKLSLWIYRCIGTIIFCCSSVLYIKNQPKNMLRLLINKVALPPEQPAQPQSAQSAQPHLMYLTQRIFSMIILGFENLNVKSDISLQTLLIELFERYLPLLITIDTHNEHSFKVADTLSKCFLETKSYFLNLILEILGSNIITIQGGNATHKNCHLVVLLIRNLIKAGKMYRIDVIESIISKCISPILNCYVRIQDHHPHKQQTIDLLRDIFLNSYYKENLTIREKLNETVWSAIQKYTTSNSKICFEFLSYVYKANADLFKYLYSKIEQIVLECEKNKRPNAAALRYSLDSVKRSIDLLKSRS